jgi:hypothetical protein
MAAFHDAFRFAIGWKSAGAVDPDLPPRAVGVAGLNGIDTPVRSVSRPDVSVRASNRAERPVRNS